MHLHIIIKFLRQGFQTLDTNRISRQTDRRDQRHYHSHIRGW